MSGLSYEERATLAPVIACEFYEAAMHYLHEQWISWEHLPANQQRWWIEKAEDGISVALSPAVEQIITVRLDEFRARAVAAIEAGELPAAKAVLHERQMRWDAPIHQGECFIDARAALYVAARIIRDLT